MKASSLFITFLLLFSTPMAYASENIVSISQDILLQQAEDAYKSEHYDEAAILLKKFKKLYPKTPYTEKAHKRLIDAYMASDQLKEAAQEMAHFRHLYSKSEHLPAVLKMQQAIQAKTGNTVIYVPFSWLVSGIIIFAGVVVTIYSITQLN